MKTWSKELIDKTRQEIEDMLTYTDEDGKKHWLIGASDLEIGAHFKNIDGKRYGIMTVENALEDKYIIDLKNSGGQESFETVDELINAGWALD